jgi:hypothetical protein
MSLQTKRNASVWEMSRSFLVFDVVPRNRFFWVAKGTTKEDVGLNTPSHGVRVLQFYSWIPGTRHDSLPPRNANYRVGMTLADPSNEQMVDFQTSP